MRKIFLGIISFIAVMSFSFSVFASELNIYIDSDGSRFFPVVKTFEEQTGIKVNFIKIDDGSFVSRIQSKPGEADLVMSAVANAISEAKSRGLLQKFNTPYIDANVPVEFRDIDDNWFGFQYRIRAMFYNPEKVDVADMPTYEGLSDPKWKGRICVRSGSHPYNINLVAWMIERHGTEYTREWLQGLKNNLAMKPNGNDRTQVKYISEGKCDISLTNSYYYGIMMSNPIERKWALKANVFFPNQETSGSFFLVNTIGLLAKANNVENANKFAEFLLTPIVQQWMSNSIYTYSVRTDVPLSRMNETLGSEQGIENGVAKKSEININDMSRHNNEALMLIDAVKFDY